MISGYFLRETTDNRTINLLLLTDPSDCPGHSQTMLDKETFSYWVTHPDDLTAADFAQMQENLAEHPYCQSLYTLAAKGASMHRKSKTVAYARQAAAYALSRNALRRLIDNEFQWSENLLYKINELSARAVPVPDDYQQESYALFKLKARSINGLGRLPLINFKLPALPEITIPEPDDSTLAETALQQDLVEQSGQPVIAQPDAYLLQQLDIIEEFIRLEPGLAPIRATIPTSEDEDDPQQEDLTKRNSQPVTAGGIATEAFAQIFVKQGKISKAIEVYEKLMVKNPAKTAYFAAKISELKQI